VTKSTRALDAALARIPNRARRRVVDADRDPNQSDLDAAARGLRMTSMSPNELDDLAKEHAGKEMFASKVIVLAAKQMAAAKRRMGARDSALNTALRLIPDRRRSRPFGLRSGLDAVLARGRSTRDADYSEHVNALKNRRDFLKSRVGSASGEERRNLEAQIRTLEKEIADHPDSKDVTGAMGGHPPGHQRRMELRASIEELEQQYADAEGTAKARIKSDLDYAKKELERTKSGGGASDKLDAALRMIPDRRRHVRDAPADIQQARQQVKRMTTQALHQLLKQQENSSSLGMEHPLTKISREELATRTDL
jgi:hypothetical protein